MCNLINLYYYLHLKQTSPIFVFGLNWSRLPNKIILSRLHSPQLVQSRNKYPLMSEHYIDSIILLVLKHLLPIPHLRHCYLLYRLLLHLLCMRMFFQNHNRTTMDVHYWYLNVNTGLSIPSTK